MNIIGRPIARIWARCEGEGDGLFLGVTLRDESGRCPLKANTVYELVEDSLDGTIKLREVGPSFVRTGAIGSATDPDAAFVQARMQTPHIAEEYQSIFSSGRGVLLSAKEMRERLETMQSPEYDDDMN